MEQSNAMPPAAARSSGAKSKSKTATFVQIILVVAFIIPIVVATIGWINDDGSGGSMAGMPGMSAPGPEIPRSLGGMSLSGDVMMGEAAVNEMRQLHGRDVGMVGGWVAHYQRNATVYVGEISDEESAVKLLEAMVSRIGAGNAVFKDLQRARFEGQELYSVFGLGQNHYFYQKGSKVIWLAAPTANEAMFLRDAFRLIN